MTGPWPGVPNRESYEPGPKRPRNNDGQDSDEDKDADLFADENEEDSKDL